jgi:hypothetical protein
MSNPVADGTAAEPHELEEPVVLGYPDHMSLEKLAEFFDDNLK